MRDKTVMEELEIVRQVRLDPGHRDGVGKVCYYCDRNNEFLLRYDTSGGEYGAAFVCKSCIDEMFARRPAK
jgi:hypothetical protein